MDADVRTLSPLERLLYLKSLAALRDLPPAELGLLAHHVRERTFRRGSKLYVAGERAGSFHVVVRGEVRVQGAEHGGSVLGPEQTIGLLTMLAGRAEGLEAVAQTEVQTLEIAYETLLDVFEDQFGLLLSQIRELGRRALAMRRDIADGTVLAPAEGRIHVDPERELGLVERVLYVRGGILGRGNLEALLELARQTQQVRFAPGERLWRVGDGSGFIYNIIHGRVRCALDGGTRHFEAGLGYPLGNLESLAGEPRWYDAVAAMPVVAMRSETATFFDLLEDHFDMAVGYLTLQASNFLDQLGRQRSVPVPAASDGGS